MTMKTMFDLDNIDIYALPYPLFDVDNLTQRAILRYCQLILIYGGGGTTSPYLCDILGDYVTFFNSCLKNDINILLDKIDKSLYNENNFITFKSLDYTIFSGSVRTNNRRQLRIVWVDKLLNSKYDTLQLWYQVRG